MRRLFWLTVGAAAGVSGYRKTARLGQLLRPARSPGGRRASRAACAPGWLARGARSAAAFARDVHEGMRLYRFSEPHAAPTLGRHHETQDMGFAVTDSECRDRVKDGH